MSSRGLLNEFSEILPALARVLDVFCILVSGILAFMWKFGGLGFPPHYQVALLIGFFLTVLLFNLSGMYRSWRGQNWWCQARVVTFAWISVVVILVIIAFMTKSGALFSRQWMGVWAVLGWGLLLTSRLSLGYFLKLMRAGGYNHKRIVIIGAGDLGQRVARNISDSSWAGLDVVGFFDDQASLHGKYLGGVKVRGSVRKLSCMVRRGHIDEVWLALPLQAEQRIKEILHELRHCTATVRYVPDIFGLQLLNHSMTEIAGLPLLNLSESPMHGLNRLVKFLEDKIIAGTILLLISPLMLFLALGVKCSSKGPVFYRQERVSWNGKSFMMLKFRSMPVSCEAGSGAVWAKKGECRATKFGAFLRKTSLDELPQFIDVLKGNMSIVGPRPERPVFVDKFKDEIPDYMKKHMVKAGITGWAQVNGWRGDTDLNKRIEYDLYYIENWSLLFDIKIIIRTVFTGFIHKNAY
ncbi:MAG: undecaprenyl-phosphate glucose phosphotransferase [Ectothiorhodospiraceae bacterium]|nr:undecaprenyl-phosphate glucose phosphotransferase [Ectothiorhodospiraceae bacterium]